jgi:hypothetical protein
MLANFLGKSKPINFIVLLLLFICAFFLNLFNTFSTEDFSLIFFIEKAILFGLFIVVFFFVNFIISKNNLTFDNSYAFLFYLLIVSFFLSYLYNFQSLVVCLVNLFFLRKIYSLQTLKDLFKKLFDAGFWLGIMCIFNPFSIVFFLFILAALIVHKRVRFQTIIIPVIGLIIPAFLLFTYSFWFDKIDQFTNNFLLYTTYNFSLYEENRFFVPLLMISIVAISAIFVKTGRALSVSNGFKKNWILLLIHLLISIAFIIFTFNRNGSELLIAALPIAVIMANGFELINKNFLKEGLLVLFIVSSFLLPLFL